MLGNRIKKARIQKNLSQEDLASKIGVTKTAISWYESNSRTPTLDNFEKLIDELELDANYVLGREVDVVSEPSNYHAKVSDDELKFIKELRKYKDTHKKIMEEPDRKAELIDRKLK
jgi:transcriptional regulator with XRE-family HTH domain